MDEAYMNATSRPNDYPTSEEPVTFRTGSNCFRYFQKSGLLLISTPDYYNKLDGRKRMGKTISIPLRSLVDEPQTLKDLLAILDTCRNAVDQKTWQSLKGSR